MKRLAHTGVVAWAAVLSTLPALGQTATDGFSVSKLSLRAFVNPDASVGLMCDATIHNRRGSPALSVLRIPTPSKRFRLDSVRAALDGAAIDDVRLPLDGDPGLEVWLGRHAIPAGGRGRLHLEYTLADEVQAADETRASLAITPPRFAGQNNVPTNLTVTVVLLPDVPASEARPNFEAESQRGTFAGRPAITWRRPRAASDEQPFTVTFPRRGMERVAARTVFSKTASSLESTWWLRAILAAAAVAIFGLTYFRVTAGRHLVVFLVVGGTLGALLLRSPGAELVLLPVLIVLAAVVEWRRRKLQGPKERRTSGSESADEATGPDDIEYVIVPDRVTISSRVFDQGADAADEEDEEDADVAIDVDDSPFEAVDPPADGQAPGSLRKE